MKGVTYPLYPFHTTGDITRSRPIVVKCPVLVSPPNVILQTFKSVANHALPCTSYGNVKNVFHHKFSTSAFSTVDIHRQFHPCTFEFLTMVTEGVDHGVHKVVILSSFGVKQ